MDFKLVDTVRLQKFKDKLLSIINNSISSEATARNAAISSAIATEISNRNTALKTKSDTGHTHSDATTKESGFMSATDKTKLDGIATGAGVQVNSDWNATSGVATILNKPSLDDYAKKTDIPTLADYAKKTDIPTLADYAKKTDIPTYTAGPGIKIENGVISIIKSKIGNPTCPGYTLYGDYFLSNTITPNKNWKEAKTMTQNVVVTQKYNYGDIETKTVTAHTLSKTELETLTAEQRKINENGHVWYWTSTPYGNAAWGVYGDGGFYGNGVNGSNDDGGARLGFKNPFI